MLGFVQKLIVLPSAQLAQNPLLAAVFCRDAKHEKMELEVKHLAPYAPFGIKVFLGKTEKDLTAISIDSKFVFVTQWGGSREKQMAGIENIKPIFRPLSEFGNSDDLRKVHEFIGLGKWCEAYDQYFDAWFNDACSVDKLVLQCPYDVLQYFFSNHYDVFGLIKEGLAIDVNTLLANGS